MKKIIGWVKSFFKPKQSTFCYCPHCENELCSTNSFVSDTGEGVDNRVVYRCSSCGKETVWNFDVFPVPVILKNNGR